MTSRGSFLATIAALAAFFPVAASGAVSIDDSNGGCTIYETPGSTGSSSLYGGTSSNEGIDKLDAEFRGNLEAMFAAAKRELGGDLQIYSGYRSVERQAELFNAAVAKYGSETAARKWVAPPGSSQHNYGKAVDLRYNGTRLGSGSQIDGWISQNAARFNLTRPMSYEPWHLEPIGARGGSASTGSYGGAGGEAEGCEIIEMPEIVLMPWLAGDNTGGAPPGSF